MTFPTEAEWAAAVKAVLTAANAVPYDLGVAVPSTVKAFNYFTVVDRFGGVARMSSDVGTRGVRIVVRSVAQYGNPADPLANARLMRQRQATALRGQRLTINGAVTTPIAFESAEAFAPEGDVLSTDTWFSADTLYTAVI